MRNLLLAIIVISTWGCHSNTTSTEKVVEPSRDENTVQVSSDQLKVIGVTTGKIEMKSLSESIKANGVLDAPPQNLISVSAPMGGFLKNTKLLQGMRVRKGEVIATLESQDYIQLQQDYYEHVAALEFLEAEFSRQEALAKENVNAQKTLQLAKSQYQSKKAMIEGLKAKLRMININPALLIDGKVFNTINLYAPISGYVTEVYVNIGKYVNTTDELFKIVDTEHLHAELYVFEKDFPKLKIGQLVDFSLVNESVVRKAHVYLIGREISEDRSVRIHCHLDTEDPTLLPGMYLKATIQTETNQVNALPNEAILSFEGEYFVFVQDSPGKFRMVKIEIGRSVDGLTEILATDDLNENSQVVLTGAFELLGKLKNMED